MSGYITPMDIYEKEKFQSKRKISTIVSTLFKFTLFLIVVGYCYYNERRYQALIDEKDTIINQIASAQNDSKNYIDASIAQINIRGDVLNKSIWDGFAKLSNYTAGNFSLISSYIAGNTSLILNYTIGNTSLILGYIAGNSSALNASLQTFSQNISGVVGLANNLMNSLNTVNNSVVWIQQTLPNINSSVVFITQTANSLNSSLIVLNTMNTTLQNLNNFTLNQNASITLLQTQYGTLQNTLGLYSNTSFTSPLMTGTSKIVSNGPLIVGSNINNGGGGDNYASFSYYPQGGLNNNGYLGIISQRNAISNTPIIMSYTPLYLVDAGLNNSTSINGGTFKIYTPGSVFFGNVNTSNIYTTNIYPTNGLFLPNVNGVGNLNYYEQSSFISTVSCGNTNSTTNITIFFSKLNNRIDLSFTPLNLICNSTVPFISFSGFPSRLVSVNAVMPNLSPVGFSCYPTNTTGSAFYISNSMVGFYPSTYSFTSGCNIGIGGISPSIYGILNYNLI